VLLHRLARALESPRPPVPAPAPVGVHVFATGMTVTVGYDAFAIDGLYLRLEENTFLQWLQKARLLIPELLSKKAMILLS
jgi:hypothetical protein